MKRGRLLFAATALAIGALGAPAWSTPPSCTATSAGDRCPTSQFEFRTHGAVPRALTLDRARGIAVAAGEDDRQATAVAFNAADGAQRWVKRLPAPGTTGEGVLLDAAVHETTGRTFLAGYGYVDNQRTVATLNAVDTSSGQLLWTSLEPLGSNLTDNVSRVLASPDGKVVYALGTRSLRGTDAVPQQYTWRATAHDAATGRVLWSWTLAGVTQALVNGSGLSADGSTLLLCGYTYSDQDRWQLVALDTRRGTRRWAYRSGLHSNFAVLAIDSARGLVATAANKSDGAGPTRLEVSVRRLATGAVSWHTSLSTEGARTLVNDVAFLDERVVVAGFTVATAPPALPVQDHDTRPLVAAFGRNGVLLWRSSPAAPAGSATATGLTVVHGRLYAHGEQDDRPTVQPATAGGAALLWHLDAAKGSTLWTGTTHGVGDPPNSDVFERTVGAVADGEGVMTLVRHVDPGNTGVGSTNAFLFQRWSA